MQRLFIIGLFIFGLNTISAQKYSFDLLVKYASEYGDRNENVIGYFNSTNHQYYLAVITRPHSSYMAYLYDFQKGQIHQFNLLEVTDGDVIDYKLEHYKTVKWKKQNQKDYQKYVFEFANVNTTDSLRRVALNVYRNAKRTAPAMTYALEIAPHPNHLFNVFRESALHPFEFIGALNYPQTGVVVKAQGHTLSGIRTRFTLEKLEKVSVEVVVP